MIHPSRAVAALTGVVCAVTLLAACGGDSVDEAAVQQQIDAAREQGERDARRDAKLRELERDLRRERRERRKQRPQQVVERVVTQPAPAAAASPSAGWIAQLGSFTSISGAERRADEVRARGLQVAVLRSDDYVEMRPGYWVVYAGFYGSRAGADSAAARAKASGVSDAFARQVTRRSN